MSLWLVAGVAFAALVLGVGIGTLAQRERIAVRVLAALRGLRPARRGARTGQAHFTLRRFEHAEGETEREGRHIDADADLALGTFALILIDVWQDHPVPGWMARSEHNVRSGLVPLVSAARDQGVLIVHCPHGRAIHQLLEPLPGEMVTDGAGEQARLVNVLRKAGVRRLFYGGYASNMCILSRPVGLIAMSQQGFDVTLVRDASLAVETGETLEGEHLHGAAVNMVEVNWGTTIDVAGFIAALRDAQ